jgi:hypothetical protein
METFNIKKSIVLAPVALVLVLGLFTACQISTSVSTGLSFEKTTMAKKVDSAWSEVTDKKFAKGDNIGLLLLNVSGFKKGDDGLNNMNIDVEVTDPDGKVIASSTDILGDAGKVDLPDNIAKTPIGTYQTTADMASGTYKIKVTVNDKISGGSATATETFELN